MLGIQQDNLPDELPRRRNLVDCGREAIATDDDVSFDAGFRFEPPDNGDLREVAGSGLDPGGLPGRSRVSKINPVVSPRVGLRNRMTSGLSTINGSDLLAPTITRLISNSFLGSV